MAEVTATPEPPVEMPVAQVVEESPATARVGDCSLVNNYDWNKQIAYAVCMGESGGNANAINWNDRHNGCVGSAGLMQIACIHTGGAHELDPVKNMAKAYEIYQRSGWKPWGAFTSGGYLRFM